jgi:hypothetical protein
VHPTSKAARLPIAYTGQAPGIIPFYAVYQYQTGVYQHNALCSFMLLLFLKQFSQLDIKTTSLFT